jgi:hypothetical protein
MGRHHAACRRWHHRHLPPARPTAGLSTLDCTHVRSWRAGPAATKHAPGIAQHMCCPCASRYHMQTAHHTALQPARPPVTNLHHCWLEGLQHSPWGYGPGAHPASTSGCWYRPGRSSSLRPSPCWCQGGRPCCWGGPHAPVVSPGAGRCVHATGAAQPSQVPLAAQAAPWGLAAGGGRQEGWQAGGLLGMLLVP